MKRYDHEIIRADTGALKLFGNVKDAKCIDRYRGQNVILQVEIEYMSTTWPFHICSHHIYSNEWWL